MKSKKGSVFFGVTIGIFVYIMGVLFLPFMVDDVDTFRTSMDCTNTSITDGAKLSCLVGDLTIPYFIWFFISIAIGFFAGART